MLALSGCGTFADDRNPQEVAVAFFEACDRGGIGEAEALASEGLEEQLESGLGAMFGGIEGYCDFHTRGGRLVEVEPLGARVDGERAQIELGFRFEPGSEGGGFGTGDTARTTWPMARESGGWKVASPD